MNWLKRLFGRKRERAAEPIGNRLPLGQGEVWRIPKFSSITTEVTDMTEPWQPGGLYPCNGTWQRHLYRGHPVCLRCGVAK